MKHSIKQQIGRWFAFILCLSLIVPSMITSLSATDEAPDYSEWSKEVTDNQIENCDELDANNEFCDQSVNENSESETENTVCSSSDCEMLTTDDELVTDENTVVIDNIQYKLDDTTKTAIVLGKGGKLTDLRIPASIINNESEYAVIAVAENAFKGYSSLKSIELSEGLIKIGDNAFNNAAAATNTDLVIPDSVKEIGIRAFAGNSFNKIIIGEGITKLTEDSFMNTWTLSGDYLEVILGSNIIEIAESAFDWGEIGKITVKGEAGKFDDFFETVGLDAEVIYDEPDMATESVLQALINNSPENDIRIEINQDYKITNTISISKEKNVILTDNGSAHSLISFTEEMFSVNGTLTISSTNAENRLTFKGDVSTNQNKGNIFHVLNGGKLVLNDGILTDGTISGIQSGAVLVENGSTFIMDGGVIEHFTLEETSSPLSAAVVIGKGSVFNMSGGIIQNNINNSKSRSGGGVILYAWQIDDPQAEMILSENAIIQNNQSSSGGGGIYMIGNALLTMKGGMILNNYANGKHGGGICIAGNGASIDSPSGEGAPVSNTRFIMDGGVISGNISYNTGGGIYVNSKNVILNAGEISNNHADSQGGGIYVSEPGKEAVLYNALITENTASVMGGGMWFCPTGEAILSVTNGAAIYDNKLEPNDDKSAAGADFVALAGTEGTIQLADRMLGGGKVEWYQDGGVTAGTSSSGTPSYNVLGQVSSDVNRYDESNPGTPLTNINGNGNYALKAVASQNAKALAKNQATLLITGNTSARGGGIGSNGSVILGEQDKEINLHVVKVWSKDTPDNKKADVTVYLKIGDKILDSVVLNTNNQWSADFKQLPNPQSLNGLEYSVVENPIPDNFTAEYQKAEFDETTHTLTITITNNYKEPHFPSPDPKPDPKEGNLTISKLVNGNQAEVTKEFTFTLTLDDSSINGTYGDLNFNKGVAVFTLMHNENKTAEGLPEGTHYSILESDNDGYTVQVTHDQGTIEEEKTIHVLFTNYKNTPAQPDKPKDDEINDDNTPTTSSEEEFENIDDGNTPTTSSKDDVPETDAQFNNVPYVIAMIFSGVLLILRKK